MVQETRGHGDVGQSLSDENVPGGSLIHLADELLGGIYACSLSVHEAARCIRHK